MVRAQSFHKKAGLKKGAWSGDEDRKLIAYINRYGIWNWTEMPKAAGLLRSGKSSRLRWLNYLRADIKHGNFTREEEETILRIHKMLGNKWSTIAAALPGRTDNDIKNYFHTHLKKRLIRSKVSTLESNQKNSRKIDPEASCLDGSGNIPVLAQNPTGLRTSPETSSAVMTNEYPNIDPNLEAGTIGEAISFWSQPLNLYEERLENMLVASGFVDSNSETFREVLISLWNQPLNLYGENENREDMFVDPGFIVPQCELQYPEPIFMSSYGFNNDAI